MKKCLLLLLLASSLLRLNAQDQTVKGKITDETGKPLAGASVTIKGTNVSALTDENGNFQITTGNALKAVFSISFIGYESVDYSSRGNSGFTVQLHQDARTLGDVIVIGYGVQRKRDVTGATTTVKAEQIVKKPVVRVEEALQGTVPGVTVQSVNGMPGQGLAVRIREPLLLVITTTRSMSSTARSAATSPRSFQMTSSPWKCSTMHPQPPSTVHAAPPASC